MILESSKNSNLHYAIWTKIKDQSLEIIQDPYGNYIVQLLLELKASEQAVQEILNVVSKEVVSLSIQKVSSNVVERCLEVSSTVSIKFNNTIILYFIIN